MKKALESWAAACKEYLAALAEFQVLMEKRRANSKPVPRGTSKEGTLS